MFYIIYKIINNINGKIYIGKHQTKDLNNGYMGSGKHLKYAISKYGIENFEKEILFQFDNEADMNAKEAELVTEEFCLREDTYNLCPGGKGGWGYINQNGLQSSISSRLKWKHTMLDKYGFTNFSNTELTKTKISNARKQEYSEGKRKSPFQLKENRFFGKTHTEKWKKQHSEFMKNNFIGKKSSQYGTMWITNGSENKKIKKEESVPEGWYKGRIIKNIAQVVKLVDTPS